MPTFFYEPLRTLASTIVDFHEGIGAPALSSTLYAFAALLLFSAFVLSIAGYLIKLPLRKYQVRAYERVRPRPATASTPPPSSKRGRRSSPWTWRWGDRLVLAVRMDGRASACA